ncbi:hypothetical protein K466DRAFT_582122 [Polyporus arcularius HHB13444]|uniref:Uncharacterized protein n=1 Tax=Polyporus arcularius HHB13444 TaxID=1314778 RepID=A0A5C3PS24_9APHY|nr:hypothetical protein K466DRAFT_582122 [Polyporus arcularius HHB13444]
MTLAGDGRIVDPTRAPSCAYLMPASGSKDRRSPCYVPPSEAVLDILLEVMERADAFRADTLMSMYSRNPHTALLYGRLFEHRFQVSLTSPDGPAIFLTHHRLPLEDQGPGKLLVIPSSITTCRINSLDDWDQSPDCVVVPPYRSQPAWDFLVKIKNQVTLLQITTAKDSHKIVHSGLDLLAQKIGVPLSSKPWQYVFVTPPTSTISTAQPISPARTEAVYTDLENWTPSAGCLQQSVAIWDWRHGTDHRPDFSWYDMKQLVEAATDVQVLESVGLPKEELQAYLRSREFDPFELCSCLPASCVVTAHKNQRDSPLVIDVLHTFRDLRCRERSSPVTCPYKHQLIVNALEMRDS